MASRVEPRSNHVPSTDLSARENTQYYHMSHALVAGRSEMAVSSDALAALASTAPSFRDAHRTMCDTLGFDPTKTTLFDSDLKKELLGKTAPTVSDLDAALGAKIQTAIEWANSKIAEVTGRTYPIVEPRVERLDGADGTTNGPRFLLNSGLLHRALLAPSTEDLQASIKQKDPKARTIGSAIMEGRESLELSILSTAVHEWVHYVRTLVVKQNSSAEGTANVLRKGMYQPAFNKKWGFLTFTEAPAILLQCKFLEENGLNHGETFEIGKKVALLKVSDKALRQDHQDQLIALADTLGRLGEDRCFSAIFQNFKSFTEDRMVFPGYPSVRVSLKLLARQLYVGEGLTERQASDRFLKDILLAESTGAPQQVFGRIRALAERDLLAAGESFQRQRSAEDKPPQERSESAVEIDNSLGDGPLFRHYMRFLHLVNPGEDFDAILLQSFCLAGEVLDASEVAPFRCKVIKLFLDAKATGEAKP